MAHNLFIDNRRVCYCCVVKRGGIIRNSGVVQHLMLEQWGRWVFKPAIMWCLSLV